jgi:AcrR family transcriptional regulator
VSTQRRGDSREARSASTDPRSNATATLLAETLKEVVRAEGYPAATVSRVARDSGVSRSGFYGHYANVDELALAVLDELMASIGELDMEGRSVPGSDGRALGEMSLELVFQAVLDNRKLYENIMLPERGGRFVDRTMTIFADRALPVVALARPDWAPARQSFAAAAVGGAIANSIAHALRSARQFTADELARDLIDIMPVWLYPDASRAALPEEACP